MSLVWNRLPAGHAFAIAVLEAHDEAGHIVSLLLVEVPGIPVDLRDPKGRLLVVKVGRWPPSLGGVIVHQLAQGVQARHH